VVSDVDGWRRGHGWGWVWGAADERGALNAVTPGRVAAALRRVEHGRVYDLGVEIDRSTFLAGVHAPTEVVPYRTPEGMAREGALGVTAGGLSFNTSMLVLSDHAGTQLDALCHATSGADSHWYNGYTAAEHGWDSGPRRAAAHNIGPVICPGVLLDLPAALGLAELPPGHPVGVADLERALAGQGGGIEPGDVVLVRTGAMRHWADPAAFAAANTAGLTLAAARWLVEEQGAILLGSDTATVECVPAADGDSFHPVHEYALVEQGVHLGELHDLEALAADAVHRFTYIALAPKVRGTTAGFAMRPVAVL
jgi:kynurenine formamidase